MSTRRGLSNPAFAMPSAALPAAFGASLALALGASLGLALGDEPAERASDARASPEATVHAVVDRYCLGCHDAEERKGRVDLELLRSEPFARHGETWAEVRTQLHEREMPPDDEPRPDEATYERVVAALDRLLAGFPAAPGAPAPTGGATTVSRVAVLEEYCVGCHAGASPEGGFDLEVVLEDAPAAHPVAWEKVVHKLRARQMPPLDEPRPSEPVYEALVSSLTRRLDAAWAADPDPGRTDTFRRLTRAEYRNAIRDLLALDIDVNELLPRDEPSQGFDNITLGGLSPTRLERYVAAADKIARLAVGAPLSAPEFDTFRIPPDRTQEQRVEGLPLGTRGGTLIPHTFPLDGNYEVVIRLARDRDEHVEGLHDTHELHVLLDRALVASFEVEPPADENHSVVDKHLRKRIRVTAGPHDLGVTFVDRSSSLAESERQPYEARFNRHRHPRRTPAVYEVSITGPFDATGPGDTPSRRRIFTARPETPGDADDEERAARKIVSKLLRRAWRRPVRADDLERPMEFYREGRAERGFEGGIERALSAILVSPGFLLRIERDPPGIEPGESYRVSDIELASRLAFFIWQSIPDDELLDLAERRMLSEPGVLEAQTRRLLADERSSALVERFAAQWLHLPNLESVTPDQRLFPDFDDNLRQALRRETELFVANVFREDRSVLDLLRASETFLDERLAAHYDIPHVRGSRFRKVSLSDESVRGGLLRQGSILTVTSYATRTSPVIRGSWILENFVGAPPPPPPPDVPALAENTVSARLPLRERLAEHRANPACSSCHELMDPVGFALENFDAVGRWRELDAGAPIDASGRLPGSQAFVGVGGLEEALLERPELFVSTLVEKLLTFALGRVVEARDAPAIREVVRRARTQDYRFSSLVLGIVESAPFRMRRSR